MFCLGFGAEFWTDRKVLPNKGLRHFGERAELSILVIMLGSKSL